MKRWIWSPVCVAVGGVWLMGCGAAHPQERGGSDERVTKLELVAVQQALDEARAQNATLEARVAELERLVLPEAQQRDPTYGAEADWVSPIVGGDGGRSFAMRCAAGSFVTGLGGRAGAVIDRIGPMCQTLLAGPQGHGDATQPAATGGGGGELLALMCPEGQVAIGLGGRAGAVIDAVHLVCTPVERTSDGTLRRTLAGHLDETAEAGGPGGKTFELLCPDETALSGLVGRSGAVVDSLAIACDPLAGH